MNASTVHRIISLIPERVARAQSGALFTMTGACRHPERIACLSQYLQWLSPLNPVSRADQQKLGDNFVVMGITKASVDDIASGKFIGTTTVGQREGSLVAEEVHIFPENMRGTGEGHYDWDLRPDSKMTNANVADVVKMANDRVMSVKYKGGEKKILVTPKTVVVTYTPSDRSELKPGAPVFAVTQRQPDGTLTAARVNVGLHGQVPPM